MNTRNNRLRCVSARTKNFLENLFSPEAVLIFGAMICLRPMAAEIVSGLKEVAEDFIDNHYGLSLDLKNRTCQLLPPEAYSCT